MLVSIKSIENGDHDLITIELQNGRKIVSSMDKTETITVIENTTSLDNPAAECAAGIALMSLKEDGVDVLVWRRLSDEAKLCAKKIESFKYSVN